ncbi:uncharacterized protein ACN427_009591 [Glossina fuscipes fuscipes]
MTLVLKVKCRACNRICGDYKHLLDETVIDSESSTLAALLTYCTTVELFQENCNALPLPEHICNSCVEHLLQSYLFKEMVLQTNHDLHEYLKQQRHELEQEKKLGGIMEPDPDIDVDVDGVDDDESKVAEQRDNNTEYINEIDGKVEKEEQEVPSDEVIVKEDQIEDKLDEKDVEYEMEEWLEPIKEEEEVEYILTDTYDDMITDEVEFEELSTEDDREFDKSLPSNKENQGEESCTAAKAEIEAENTEEEKEEWEFVATEEKPKTTLKKSHVKRRSLKDGNITQEDLTCKHCGKQFDKLCRLREHTYMHTGEKPHVCAVCGKRSRTKTHHNVHMQTHSETRRYKCQICTRMYRTSNSLKVHIRKHSDIRPYNCPLCEKSFHTGEQRKLHVMLHTGERPFSCTKCGKAYRENYSLRLHMQTHEDKKPYQCEVCGKGLTQMSGYKRHMLLHTGEYPHKCDVCGRAFRISSNLVAHKRLHLDVLPFQCKDCNKGFTTSSRLKRHMIRHECGDEQESTECTFKPRKQKSQSILVDAKMARSKVVEII